MDVSTVNINECITNSDANEQSPMARVRDQYQSISSGDFRFIYRGGLNPQRSTSLKII